MRMGKEREGTTFFPYEAGDAPDWPRTTTAHLLAPLTAPSDQSDGAKSCNGTAPFLMTFRNRSDSNLYVYTA